LPGQAEAVSDDCVRVVAYRRGALGMEGDAIRLSGEPAEMNR